MASQGDYIIICLLAVVSVLSFIGGLLIIVAALVNKKLRGFTHVLIINQAVADLVLSGLSLPLRILRMATASKLLESSVVASRNYCTYTTFASIVIFGVSVYSLFLLTLDRFLGIRFPLQYRIRMRTSYFVISVALTWLIPLIIGVLPVFFSEFKSDKLLYDTACVYGTVISLQYMLFVNVSTLFLPLFIMICMYLLIIRKVHLSWKAMRRTISKQKNQLRRVSVVNPAIFKRRELRLARGIFCILFIHVACLTPIVIVDWIQTFNGVESPLTVIRICLFLTYANAVIDPLIYATFSKEFKATFWSFFKCNCLQYGRRGSTSSFSRVAFNNNLAKIFTEAVPTVDSITPGIIPEENKDTLNCQNPDCVDVSLE